MVQSRYARVTEQVYLSATFVMLQAGNIANVRKCFRLVRPMKYV